ERGRLVRPRLFGVKLERMVVRATPVYLPVYRNDGRRRVLRLGVGRDPAQRLPRLLLQGQGVAVEDAPRPVPGNGHRLVRRDAGIHEVGDGGETQAPRRPIPKDTEPPLSKTARAAMLRRGGR